LKGISLEVRKQSQYDKKHGQDCQTFRWLNIVKIESHPRKPHPSLLKPHIDFFGHKNFPVKYKKCKEIL